MKKIILVAALLMSMAISINAQNSKGMYAIKSGYIKYELTGSTTGTKELWWDNYGKKNCELIKSETVTKVFGITEKNKQHSLKITNKNIVYMIDYINNKNTKSEIPYYASQSFADNMTEAEQEKLAEDILNNLGGKRLGKEKVLNYNCEKISLFGVITWVYKGVTIKSTAKIMGIENNEIATTFKPNIKLSDSKFNPPADVNFDNLMTQSQAEKNPFAIMAEEMNKEIENENNNNDKIVSTKYPYDVFQKKINAFNYDGYAKFMVNSIDGVHTGMYMKGFTNSIAVVATSKQNNEGNHIPRDKQFIHKGKKCYYDTENQEGKEAAVLMIDIPKYDTYILIAISPKISKAEILKIADKFNF